MKILKHIIYLDDFEKLYQSKKYEKVDKILRVYRIENIWKFSRDAEALRKFEEI